MKNKFEIARICFDGSLTTTILDGDHYYLRDGMIYIYAEQFAVNEKEATVIGERLVAMVPIDNLHYIREVNP